MRTFVGRSIVSFYHDWTSTSTSDADALAMLRKEAMMFLDAGTLAVHKPSFSSDVQVLPQFLFTFVTNVGIRRRSRRTASTRWT